MYPLKAFETSSSTLLHTNEDGYHTSEESIFASFKEKQYKLQMNPFSSRYGTLEEDHAFYYSDLLDIINNERDPSRRRHRFKVILHGSKEKQTRPLFQNYEAPTTWTSSLRLTMKRYVMMGRTRGLDENFQMMVELGFVNHLLMFMTHGYRYLYQKKKFKHLNLPVAPENVDCFMYEKKDFLRGEHAHYPVYSAELLNGILLMADDRTFKAIIERYFTEEQNGPSSSEMINDGRHVIMNGVGVLYKVLKYSVVTQRDLVTGIIRTIVDRCINLGLDLPSFILLNDTYPLNEAILQYIKDYQNPEKMWNEFNEEGFYQSDIFPNMDAEYNEAGANNARRWLLSSLSRAAKTMIILTMNARRKGRRRKMFTQGMLFELLELIDKFPHADNFITLFSSVRSILINLFSLFLYDEEKLDQDGNIEQPFEIDYQLLEELTKFPIERFCSHLTRINFDPFYSLSNIKRLMADCEKKDQGLEDSLSVVFKKIIAEELSLVELLSWLSHNPILSSKIANFENGTMIDLLIDSTDIEKADSDRTNIKEYCSIFSRTNVIAIADENGRIHNISIPRYASSYIILGNILQVIPELNEKINGDGLFYQRYYVKFLSAKKGINDIDVSQLKDYQSALIEYKKTFIILNNILEENYPISGTIKTDRVTIASNIGEMAIRLNNKHFAEKYVMYALKLDPNHDKSKKRLETISKMK